MQKPRWPLKYANAIQIQHLLKLNLLRYHNIQDFFHSNTTFVKVKCQIAGDIASNV